MNFCHVNMESLSLPPHTHKTPSLPLWVFFFTPLPFIPPPILTEPRGGMGTERKTIVLVVITVAHMSAQMKIQKKSQPRRRIKTLLCCARIAPARKKTTSRNHSDLFLALGEKEHCVVRSVLPTAAQKKARGSCIWMTVAVLRKVITVGSFISHRGYISWRNFPI